VPLQRGARPSDAKMEQDNQKLFLALYSAVETSWPILPSLAQKGTATSGQLAGLDDRFQNGTGAGPAYPSRRRQLQTISKLADGQSPLTRSPPTARNFFSSATSPYATYATKQLVDKFQSQQTRCQGRPFRAIGTVFHTIAIKKGLAVTTKRTESNLSQVPGTLDIRAIVITYINGQLSAGQVFLDPLYSKNADGRHHHPSNTNATLLAMQVHARRGGVEQVSFQAHVHRPSLYLVGSSGLATENQDKPPTP